MAGKPKVNISLAKIEEAKTMCKSIASSLGGPEGAVAFREAQKEIETNLEGEYADVLSNSVLKSKESYLDSLSNVTALKAVLTEYKKYLKNGSNGKLRNNGDEIKIDMDQIYKQIRNLEDTITAEGNLKKVLESDEGFDNWQTAYWKSLDDSWTKTYEVDEYGNMTEAGILAHLEDKKKEEVFKANNASLIDLDAIIAGGLASTASIVTELEAISGVISGELSDFSAIWDVFDFSKADYKRLLVAQYNKLDKETKGNVDADLGFLKRNFEEIMNAIQEAENGNWDEVIGLLNKMLSNDGSGFSAEQENIAMNALLGLTTGMLLIMNMKAFAVAPEDREEFYSRFKNLEKLNTILMHLKTATTDDGTELYDGMNNDISKIFYDPSKEKLIIYFDGRAPSKEFDVSILDTDGAKLISDDLDAWGKALSAEEKEAFMLAFAIATMGESEIAGVTVKSISVAQQNIEASKKILSDVMKNQEAIGEVEVIKGKTINDVLGITTDGEGNAIINFIPIIVVNTFVANGGNFYRMPEDIYDIDNDVQIPPKYVPVDWSNKESVELWLDMPYEGDTSSSNGDVLERIRETMNLPLGPNDYAGQYEIGGWNFTGV